MQNNTDTTPKTDTEPTCGEVLNQVNCQLDDLNDTFVRLDNVLQEYANTLRAEVTRQSANR